MTYTYHVHDDSCYGYSHYSEGAYSRDLRYKGGPGNSIQWYCTVCGLSTHSDWEPDGNLRQNTDTHKNGICYKKQVKICGMSENTIVSAQIVFK